MYPKPPGYNTVSLATGSQSYVPFNGFRSGFGPVVMTSEVLTLTFSDKPDDGSGFEIQDPEGLVAFEYVYGGSPASNIIPLVSGGGTAAQAATATQVALAAQLVSWIVTNPSAGVVVLVQKQKGVSPDITLTDDPNITVDTDLATFSNVLPGRFGKNYCFLPDDSIITEIGAEEG